MLGDTWVPLLCNMFHAAGNGNEVIGEWSALSNVKQRRNQYTQAHTTSMIQDLPFLWTASPRVALGISHFSHQFSSISLSFVRPLLDWQEVIHVRNHKGKFSNLLAFPCEKWQRIHRNNHCYTRTDSYVSYIFLMADTSLYSLDNLSSVIMMTIYIT